MTGQRTGHLSNLALDALALGGGSPDDSAHLAGCAACQARAGAGEALRGELPPHLRVRTLEALRARARWTVIVGALVPALAAAILFAVWPRASAEPDLAVKGGAALEVYALRAQHVRALADGSPLSPGDQIRFAVTPGGARHVLIASVDSLGHTTIYVPYGGAIGLAVDPHHRTELPGSIVLDDSLGPERVFAIFAAQPIRAADVQPALDLVAAGRGRLRTTAQLMLPFPATQRSLWFDKTPGREAP